MRNVTVPGVPPAPAVQVGPPPAPATEPTTGTPTTGEAAGKPATGDPVKVRTKQIHPLVAKAMAHLLTPPVLAALGMMLLGVQVLLWVVAGWRWAVAVNLLVGMLAFWAALAWRRAAVARKAAARKTGGGGKDQERRPGRLGLPSWLRRRPAGTGRDAAGGGSSDTAGGGGGGRGRHRRPGLGSRVAGLFAGSRGGRRGGGGGVSGGAHSGGSGGPGGGPAGGGGGGGRKPGRLGRLGGLLKRKKPGAGGGHGGGAGHHSGGHSGGGSSRGGSTPGSKKGRLRLRVPSFLRRKDTGSHGGGGSPSGGGGHGGGQQPRGRRTRRGGRGGDNGGNHNQTATNTTNAKKGPGFWRRLARDLKTGSGQGADAVSGVGVRKPKQEQPTDRKPEPRRAEARKPEPPKDTQPARRPEPQNRPVNADRKQPDNTQPRRREQRPQPVESTAPPSGARNEGNSPMAIRILEDMSLQKWGRTLGEITPALDEVAGDFEQKVSAVGVVADSVKQLAQYGEADLPALKPLVAEVDAVAAEAAAIQAEGEALLRRMRTLATRAEPLAGMYKRGHFSDEDRMDGIRGSRQAEKRADVGAAERDV